MRKHVVSSSAVYKRLFLYFNQPWSTKAMKHRNNYFVEKLRKALEVQRSMWILYKKYYTCELTGWVAEYVSIFIFRLNILKWSSEIATAIEPLMSSFSKELEHTFSKETCRMSSLKNYCDAHFMFSQTLQKVTAALYFLKIPIIYQCLCHEHQFYLFMTDFPFPGWFLLLNYWKLMPKLSGTWKNHCNVFSGSININLILFYFLFQQLFSDIWTKLLIIRCL